MLLSNLYMRLSTGLPSAPFAVLIDDNYPNYFIPLPGKSSFDGREQDALIRFLLDSSGHMKFNGYLCDHFAFPVRNP